MEKVCVKLLKSRSADIYTFCGRRVKGVWTYDYDPLYWEVVGVMPIGVMISGHELKEDAA